MSDYPSTGLAYDDPFAQASHNNKIVTGKELAQIQRVGLDGRSYAMLNALGAGAGVKSGSNNGTTRRIPYVPTQVLTKTDNYRLKVEDYGALVLMNVSTTGKIVTLPNPQAAGNGWWCIVKKINSSTTNTVGVSRNASETIDGRSANETIIAQYAEVAYMTDGANWFVLWANDYVDARQTTVSNYFGSDTFGDGATISSLPPGEWDVSGAVQSNRNGASVTIVYLGCSPNSGTSAAGLTIGDNYFQGPGPVGTVDCYCFVPPFRVSQTAAAAYYLKCAAQYTVATPQYRCRISARRVG
jgi:hypothetical protein